jgi:murein DD-endopeptidase MepM/ murein hydrolase activator NlpD
MILPIPQKNWDEVTQAYGVPNDWYESGIHNGTDFSCPEGTPIVAPTDGEITHRFTFHPTMGNAIHFSCDHFSCYLRFLHLSKAMPKGKYREGEVIGYTGNTGMSTGGHVHIDVWNRPINVGLIKTSTGVFKYTEDPVEFFNNLI